MVAEVSNEEVFSIQQAVLRRYGMDFSNYEVKSFRRRVQRIYRKFGFQSSADLWHRILTDENFIHDFVDEVAVGLTAMFRDPEMWVFMKKYLRSEFLNKEDFSVWHAGCSSGEEIYTMGIVMRDAGVLDKANVLATDMSQQALKQAKSGTISLVKWREYQRNYEEYNRIARFEQFVKTDDYNFQIKPYLFQHVKFQQNNLITDRMPGTAKYDIIFCRNVMIYFDAMAKEKTMEMFSRMLKPGGILVVGFFDSILGLLDKTDFTPFSLSNRIFIKNPY